jgi:hypothetical protein
MINSRARLGRVLELLALAGLILIAGHVLLVVTGPNVADIRPSGFNITGADQVMSVRGDLAFPVDFGDRLSWIETDDGTRDAATGLAPVELGGPVQAELTFWSPTRSQRASWAVGQLFAPMLTLAGIWIVYQLVRSTRTGDPFTAENERRLWLLAGVIGIGGTLNSMVTGFTDLLLIQRSAAADLFQVSATITFLPLVLGLVIALLALVWRIGIHMREDLEGTI